MVLVVVPLDEIKIYKAFVLGLGADADPADVAIVQAVIAMARPLRCEVVTWPKATISPVRCPRQRSSSGHGRLPGGCADKMRQLSLRHGRSFAALRMTGEIARWLSGARIGPGDPSLRSG